MNGNLIIGLIFCLIGLLIILFREGIIKVQGPNKNDNWPLDVRKKRILLAGLILILAGLLVLFDII